jgi:tetratricopeptide (TPR) repeat protein
LGQSSHLYSRLWLNDQLGATTQPIALLDEALRVAGSHPPQLRLWLLSRRAEEHAAAKEATASLRDLDDAEQVAASIQSRDDGFLAHWDVAPAARLAAYRGNCAQLLNRPADAIAAIEREIGAIDPGLISVRSSVLADLAAAYAQQEEIERACALLLESLDIAERAGLRPYIQRVMSVRRQLGHWSGQREVKQLDERLRVAG